MSRRKFIPKDRLSRHVRLMEFMLASTAWQSLDPVARALYVEISRRYRGPNSNNGKIAYSVREAAAVLNVGRNTANRAFHHLAQRGFIVPKTPSGFNVKGRTSTEWLLTEFPDDTQTGTNIATKNFMSWTPPTPIHSPTRATQNSFHSPTKETLSPAREPHVAARRDRVAR
jgi:DNA-binding transcriptional regulator YhcF (GntR family)